MPSIPRSAVVPDDLREKIKGFAKPGKPPESIPFDKADWMSYGSKGQEIMAALMELEKDQRRIYGRGILENDTERRNEYWKNWLEIRRILFEAERIGMWKIESFQRNLRGAGVVPIILGEQLVIRTPFREFLSWETGEIVEVTEEQLRMQKTA